MKIPTIVLSSMSFTPISLFPNVCGSTWNEPFVPDSFGFANFNEACRKHDQCYDTCGADKDECDETFHQNLRAVCDNAYPIINVPFAGNIGVNIHNRLCKEFANTYYSAVKRGGGDAYREAQQNCTSPSPSSSPSISNEWLCFQLGNRWECIMP